MTERGEASPQGVVNCRNCRHYYITWDKKFPHGCKAAGFKSGRVPAAEVLAVSGKACLSFQEKRAK